MHFENVDKQEVNIWFPNMERKSMICRLNFLISKGMTIMEMVTDS